MAMASAGVDDEAIAHAAALASKLPHRINVTVDGLTFDSDFDSGSLLKVGSAGDGVYDLKLAVDCVGTEFVSSCKSWYYFSVQGGTAGQRITMNIRMTKNSRLYNAGHEPLVWVKHSESSPRSWGRHLRSCQYGEDEDDEDLHLLSFTYVFPKDTCASTKVYFAHCYPFSYTECQQLLAKLQDSFPVIELAAKADEASPDPGANTPTTDTVYFHRELLIRSWEGLRVDLLTISSRHGLTTEREPRLPGCFPDRQTKRCHVFEGKKVFFLSSRVHPGETPGAFVFNGFLKFILSSDPRAVELRRMYVFKLVPILNPDGVFFGHYRTDRRGVNLNRFYGEPDVKTQPSIYAAKTVVVHHNRIGTLEYYVDLHGHATKKGCFIYGNALEPARQTLNLMYPRLIALNTPHFDYGACNFSEKNMFSQDKRDGLSKEGSGRVGIFLATNMTHSYTLECNYFTGKVVNSLPPAAGEGRDKDPAPLAGLPPKYTEAHYEDVGRAVAIAALDMFDKNPWTRLPESEFGSLSGLRKWAASAARAQASKKSGSSMHSRKLIQAARRRMAEEDEDRKSGATLHAVRSSERLRPTQKLSPASQRAKPRSAVSPRARRAAPVARTNSAVITKSQISKAASAGESSTPLPNSPGSPSVSKKAPSKPLLDRKKLQPSRSRESFVAKQATVSLRVPKPTSVKDRASRSVASVAKNSPVLQPKRISLELNNSGQPPVRVPAFGRRTKSLKSVK